jgi:hypothetical protein
MNWMMFLLVVAEIGRYWSRFRPLFAHAVGVLAATRSMCQLRELSPADKAAGQ